MQKPCLATLPEKVRHAATERLHAQFTAKNEILQKYFQNVSPLDLYTDIFGSTETVLPYVEESKGSVRRSPVEEILLYSIGRDDVYIPYCTFLNNWYRKATADRLHAFVIDLDGFNPENLRYFLMSGYQKIGCKPTHIVNSGSGLHMIYLLDSPFACYHRHHSALSAIQNGLCDLFQSSGNQASYKLDRHWWGHTYRIAGSCTKLGQTATAYRTKPGQKVSIEALAKTFKVTLDTSEGRQGKGMIKKKPKAQIIDFKTGSPIRTRFGRTTRVFWDWAFDYIPNHAEPGHRYNSLFVLSVIAQKCRIPEEEVLDKISLIFRMYNEDVLTKALPAHLMDEGELRKALKGYYDDQFVNLTSAKLEELLGFKFPRKTKRIGRSREQHLTRLNALRRGGTKELILTYLKKHPEATNTELARALNMSRRNVIRYRKI